MPAQPASDRYAEMIAAADGHTARTMRAVRQALREAAGWRYDPVAGCRTLDFADGSALTLAAWIEPLISGRRRVRTPKIIGPPDMV